MKQTLCPAADGRFRFNTGGMTLKGRPSLALNGIRQENGWRYRGGRYVLANREGRFVFALSAEGDRLSVGFHARLKKPARSVDIALWEMSALAADHLATQGQASDASETLALPLKKKRSVESHYQTMIRRGKKYLHFHTPLEAKHPLVFTAEAAGKTLRRLAVKTELRHFDGLEIDAGPLIVEAVGDPRESMTRYAEANRTSPRTDAPSPAGWNSWDYYRWTVTEEEVLENARFIANDPVLRRHVKRVIVDDGWQYCYGEWEANSLFPSGMKKLAREIARMGFEPGLWFAPGIAEPHSRIAQWHTDMLALGESGLPCLGFSCMERKGFLLDPTHEKTEKFLTDTFRRYADHGYRYFKLDFLRFVQNARQFADRRAGKGELARRLVEPIRRATRGRAFLMGCSYPYFAGCGLVDAVRIAGDIHARWESIKKNSESLAARFWMHGRLFACDPDFSLCRSPDTSDDPDMTRLRARLVFIHPENTDGQGHEIPLVEDVGRAQMELSLSLAIISGGEINLSDKMTRLNPSGLELARKTVSAPRGEPGVPLDLFHAARAATWLQKVGGGVRLLLINWEDRPRQAIFNLEEHGLSGLPMKDFWSGEKLAGVKRLERELPPRSGILLEMTP